MSCHYCHGKGCFCEVAHTPENPFPPEGVKCVLCDVCDGAGEMFEVDAEEVRADDAWKRGFSPRQFLVVLFIPSILLGFGCKDDGKADGWDTDDFRPSLAESYRTTPGGYSRDARPFAAGFVTDEELDAKVDEGFGRFYALYPEYASEPPAKVSLYPDYVFWVTGAGWAAGWNYDNRRIVVTLFSRGTSTTDPGAQFIKRAPDGSYPWWRFTASPLAPAVCHEQLHTVIGDGRHLSPLWSRMNAPALASEGYDAWTCEAVNP